ncbi:MAG TPA: 3'(2'),5'-bisphosphate nucleotidase [Planctomycetaceae bacterium]|nr:3'(2'),5'-bisphosphate nucleotidase [Planctomycetaceae bacterium]
MSSYEREVATAVAAVGQAAAVCQRVQSEISPESLAKKDKSPVTVADYSSQALICRELERAFPDDPVIAEEDSAELRTPDHADFLQRVHAQIERQDIHASTDQICQWIDRGNTKAFCPRFWTLDPIDGTKGFLRGEQYAISLALVVNGEIVVAALACPNLPFGDGKGAVYSAVKGKGANAVALAGKSQPTPIHVSPRTRAADARFCESVEAGHSSHSESEEVAQRVGTTALPVRIDSQAKYALVASGEAEVYLRLPTRADYREKIWDHAGGVLVATEAGGQVTDVTGKPLDFTQGRELVMNRGVVVTNGQVHAPILKALADIGVR